MFPQYDFLFSTMITLGVIAMLIYFVFMIKKHKIKDELIDRLIIILAISGAAMLFSANYFNTLFHYLSSNPFTFKALFTILSELQGITYLAGFMGGAIVFILLFWIFLKSERKNMLFYLNIVVTGVVLAHAFGRIGCFLAGCCYGTETSAWYGIIFPAGSPASFHYHDGLESVKVIPTQLIEAIFLFGLFGVLAYLKKNQLAIYFLSYGIFRFLIEFIRDDARGTFIPGLSPSQFLSLIAILIGILMLLYPLFCKLNFKKAMKQ